MLGAAEGLHTAGLRCADTSRVDSKVGKVATRGRSNDAAARRNKAGVRCVAVTRDVESTFASAAVNSAWAKAVDAAVRAGANKIIDVVDRHNTPGLRCTDTSRVDSKVGKVATRGRSVDHAARHNRAGNRAKVVDDAARHNRAGNRAKDLEAARGVGVDGATVVVERGSMSGRLGEAGMGWERRKIVNAQMLGPGGHSGRWGSSGGLEIRREFGAFDVRASGKQEVIFERRRWLRGTKRRSLR